MKTIRIFLMFVLWYCISISQHSLAQCTSGVTANFTFTGDNVCANGSVRFTSTSTGSGLTYEWNFGNPTSGSANTSTLQNPNHHYISDGTGVATFPVQLIATNGAGCKDTIVKNVSIKQLPGAALEDPINNFRNCDGTIYNMQVFDITPVTGTAYRIVWGDGSADFTGGSFPGGGLTHTYATDQIYNLLYIVTGANGCSDTSKITVANITNPSIGAANPGGTTGCGPLEICFPLNNFSSNHVSTIYTIDFGDGTPIDTIQHPPPNQLCHTYVKTSCGNGTNNAYTFKINAINFCDVSEATITPIKVFLKPAAKFTNPPAACVNSNVNFSNQTQPGFFGSSCSQFTQLEWDFGDGTIVNTNSITDMQHVYTSTGNYTVKLKATNNCGDSIYQQNICIEDIPTPDFTLDQDSACVPFSVNTKNLSVSGINCSLTYAWNVGLMANSCNQSQFQTNFIAGTSASSFEPVIEFIDPAVYQVQLVLTNSCGVFSKSLPIVAQGPPQVSINSPATICAGESITPTGNVVSCMTPITAYQWTFAGGSPGSSNIEIPGTVSYASAGTFNMTFKVTNACGSQTATNSIVVNSAPGKLRPKISGTVCPGGDVQLTSDAVAGVVYTWTGPNGFFSNQQNPLIIAATSINEGLYTVSAAIGSCNGPSDTVRLKLLTAPVVDAGPDKDFCLQSPATTIVPTTATGGTWSGTGITSGGLFTPATAGVGAHTLTYQFTDPVSGCQASDVLIATVHALPVVDAGPDLSFCVQATPVTLSGNPSGGTWSGTGITNASGEFTPSTTGSFKVVYKFTDGFGCFARDTLQIAVVNASSANAGNDTTACEDGAVIQLTGTPVGGVWNGSNITSGGTFTPTASGLISVVYEIGSGTCVARDTLKVNVIAKPVVNAGADFSSCTNGSAITLSGTPAGGTWTGTGITNPSGTFDPVVAGPGSFVLTYAFTSVVTGCAATDDVQVQVQASPVVDAGVDTTLCNQPFPVQLSASPTGGTWSGSNVTPSGVFTPSASGTFVLTYSLSATPPCAASDTRTITVVNPAVADAGPDLSLCYNDIPGLLTASPPGGTWTGAVITSGGQIDLTAIGSYTLHYAFGSGNCYTEDSLQVVIQTLPVVSVDPDLTFCPYNAPHLFSGSPTGGTWSGMAITGGGLFDPAAALADDQPHFLLYSFTESTTGCTNRDSLSVTVFSPPVAAYSVQPIGCSQQNIPFTNQSVNATAYRWDFGDGSAIGINTNENHTFATADFYDVALIAQNASGCEDTIIQTIEIRESALPAYSLSVGQGCGPLSVDFVNASSGIGTLTYFWDFGNGQTSVLDQPGTVVYNPGVLDDTTYYIRLDVTNFCGTVSLTDSVLVSPKPVAVFGTLFDQGCTPFNADIANISYGNPSGFDWLFGDGTSASNSDALFSHLYFTGNEDTTYRIRLIVSNACGSDTAFHDIHVLPKSVNSFFNTDLTQGCAPLTVNLTSFSSGAQFHNWSFGDGNVSAASAVNHTYTQAGTYQVMLVVNDACSSDTSFASITVFPQPVIDFSFTPATLCIGQTFHFTNLSSGVTNLLWDFGDGGTSGLTDPDYIYQAGGTYAVTLSATSTSNQCVSSIVKNVSVSAAPLVDFTFPVLDNCAPENLTFTNTSSGFNFITWDFGDGNVSTSVNPAHTFVDPGNYDIKLIAENNAGCKDSVIQTLTIHPRPVADFALTAADSCIFPTTVSFQNLSSGANDYHWYFGNGNESFLTDPTTTYLSAGTYSIKLVVQNAFTCADSVIKPLTIHQPPVAALQLAKTSFCQREDFNLVSLSQFADSVIWNMGDGSRLKGSDLFFHYDSVGFYQVEIVAYGSGGCTDTARTSQLISVLETPTADFEYFNLENEGLKDGSIQFVNHSVFADQYAWEFNNLLFSTDTHPLYRYEQPGPALITLIAVNDNGCRDTLIEPIIIDFFKGLYIPNAMNPGHPVFDVANFVPKGVGLSDYHIGIYDDWGNLIWESDALDDNGRPTGYWDGTFNGVMVQQDAYVWKVEATYRNAEVWEGKKYANGKIKRSGTVTVIH